MDPRFLNPADAERVLTEEVHYLHGLWRRGPPPNWRRNASPNRDANLVHPPAASRQPNFQNRWRSETPTDAERVLTEEVHNLHGLWRSGPPPNRKRKASPNRDASLVHPGPAASREPNLENRRWSETPQLRSCDEAEAQNPVPAGDPTPGGRGSGDAELDRAWMRPSPEQESYPREWGVFRPSPAPEPSRPPPPLSAEEQAERVAATALRSAMKASKNYFARKVKDGEDEDDSSSDDYDESDNVDEEEAQGNHAKTRAFKFFIGLFVEDEVLREYYEKKKEKGDFACLACAELGIWGKTYKDCQSLLQHAFSIRKTKRQIEHRAFARAVCRVLGYNSSRLPSLVLDGGDTLGQALEKARAVKLGVQNEDATGNY